MSKFLRLRRLLGSMHSSRSGRCLPTRRSRLHLNLLEDRIVPTEFAVLLNQNLVLTLADNEQLSIVAASNQILITDSVTDTDPGINGVTVSGTAITINESAFTGLTVVDNGVAAGAQVAFSDSGSNAYLIPVTVALTDLASGDVTFSGTSTFLNVGLSVQAAGGTIISTGTSALSLSGASGILSLTAGNDVTLLGNVSVAATTNLEAGSSIAATNSANSFNGDVSVFMHHGLGQREWDDLEIAASGSLTLGTSTFDVTAPGPDSFITALGNITLDPNDSLSGSSAGPALDFSSSTGSIDLDGNGTNDLTFPIGASVTGSNTITVSNTTVTELGNIVTGTPPSGTAALSVTSGGTISQETDTSITSGGQTSFFIDGATGDITLDQQDNNFSGGVIFDTTGGGSIVNATLVNDSPEAQLPADREGSTPSLSELTLGFGSTGISLPSLTIPDGLTVTADGPITQTGPITAGSASFSVEGDYPITLDNSQNDISGDLSISGPSSSQPVVVENSQSIEIDSWSWGVGRCSVIAETGNITEDTANGAAFTQEEGAGAVTFEADDPTIAAVSLMADTAAGDFNDFTNYVIIEGKNVNTVVFENSDPRATIDTLATPSTTGLNPINGLTLPSAVTNLTLQFDNAPIDFDANSATQELVLTALTVTATGIRSPNGVDTLTMNVANPANQATFNAGAFPIDLTGNGIFNNITLSNSGPNTVVFNNAGTAPLNFTGSTQLGSGPVTITNNGIGTSGGITEGSAPSTGSISQASFGDVNGDGIPDIVSLASANGPIDLNSLTNAFTGAISVVGPNGTSADSQNVSLTNNSNLILGDITTSAQATLTATSKGGNVLQAPGTALLLGKGDGAFSAGDNITLGSANNSFSGTLSIAAFPDGSAVVTGYLSGVQFGNVETNNLTVQAGGPITQATGTGITVAGEASFSAGSNNITLDSPNNSIAIGDMNNDGQADEIVNNGDLTLNQFTLGNTSLTVTTTGNLDESADGAITQTGAAPIELDVGTNTGGGSIVLGNSANNFQGTVVLDSHTSRLVPTDTTLTTAGNLTVVAGTGDTITGNLNLTAGGIVTLPTDLTSLNSLEITADQTTVNSDITVTGTNVSGDAISFIGPVSLAGGITIDASVANANVTFDGNVTVTGTGDLSFAMGNDTSVILLAGTWDEGSNNLDFTANGGSTGLSFGQGVNFDIGSPSAPAQPAPAAVFAMDGGDLNGDGILDLVSVDADGTLQIGSTGGGQTVTLNFGTGGLVFAAGSSYEFGQGTTNAELIDAGSGDIDLSGNPALVGDGLAGSTPSPFLATTTAGGAIEGNFLQQTLYGPQDAIDDGGDIVTTALTASITGQQFVLDGTNSHDAGTQVTSGIVTISTNGSYSGYTSSGDLVTITTNAVAGAELVVLQNPGGFGLVIRKTQDSSSPVYLSITTKAANGTGISQIDGIADWGSGPLTINAPDSDFGGALDEQPTESVALTFQKIEVAGTLTALTANNLGFTFQTDDRCPFTITDGGTGATTIKANAIAGTNVNLQGRLTSLTATSVDSASELSATSFGTITTTGNLAAGDPGNFGAVMLAIRKAGKEQQYFISKVTVAGDLSGTWYVSGNIGSVSATDATGYNVLRGTATGGPYSIASLSLGVVSGVTIDTGGIIGTFTATSIDAGGSSGSTGATATSLIQAASIGTLTTTDSAALNEPHWVPPNCVDLTLQLTGSLGTLNVAGDMDDTAIDGQSAKATIGTITATGGIDGGDIENVASIASVTAGGIDNWTVQAGTFSIMKVSDKASAPLNNSVVDTDITLTGSNSTSSSAQTLGTVSVTGPIEDSTFDVQNGSVGTITAAGLMDDTISGNGSIAGITCTDDWETTDVTASSIGKISVEGSAADLDDSDIVEFGTLQLEGKRQHPLSSTSLAVADNMDSDTVVDPNGISSLSVEGQINQTYLDVEGVPSQTTSTAIGKIGTLTAAALTDSVLAANALGTIDIDTTGSGGSLSKDLGITTSTIVVNGEGITTKAVTSFSVGNSFDAASTLTSFGGVGSVNVANDFQGEIDLPSWSWGTTNTGSSVISNPSTGQLGTFTAGEVDGGTVSSMFIARYNADGSVVWATAGDVENSNIYAIGVSATEPAIGALSVAGNCEDNAILAWGQVTSFTVADTLLMPALLKAKEKANQSKCAIGVATGGNVLTGVGTFTVGDMTDVTLVTQYAHAMQLVGNHKDVMQAVTLNVLGNNKGTGIGSFTAAGPVLNSLLDVADGNVGSFSAAAFIDSDLLVGAQLPNAKDPNGTPPVFTGAFSIGSFQTTGTFDSADVADSASFQNSSVGAATLGTLSLSGVNPVASSGSGIVSFGLFFSPGSDKGKKEEGKVTVDGSKTPLAPSDQPQKLGGSTTDDAFFYEG